MFRFNDKTSAFTLVELLIVMVLSSIIVVVIYFTYYTVATFHVQLLRKQRVVEDMSTLYFLLKKDADKCRTIKPNHAMSFSCISEGDWSVDYVFDSLYVLRIQTARVDTFYCRVKSVSCFFENTPIEKHSEVIDKINVGIQGLTQPLNISIMKKYDAASLITTTQKDSLP